MSSAEKNFLVSGEERSQLRFSVGGARVLNVIVFQMCGANEPVSCSILCFVSTEPVQKNSFSFGVLCILHSAKYD